MFNKKSGEQIEGYSGIKWDKSPSYRSNYRAPRKTSDNTSTEGKKQVGYRRYSDYRNSKARDNTANFSKNEDKPYLAFNIPSKNKSKEKGNVEDEEKFPSDPKTSERPPLKINYSNYSNTYFFPKSVVNNQSQMHKLQQNYFTEDEKKLNAELDLHSSSSTRYNSFHLKLPNEGDSVTPFMANDKDIISPMRQQPYRKSNTGIPMSPYNKWQDPRLAFSQDNGLVKNFLSENNFPQILSHGKPPSQNINYFTQPFSPNVYRPVYNNYTSQNTISTTSTLEEHLISNPKTDLNLRKHSSFTTKTPNIKQDRRKSFTCGESEGLKENLSLKSNKCPQIKNYNKFSMTVNTRENTEILNVKFNYDGYKTLRISRFDDVLQTVKYFCEENRIPDYFLKSIVINITQALDNIYKIYNSRLGKLDMENIKSLENLWEKSNANLKSHEEKVELDITSISNISIPLDTNEEDFLNNFSVFNNSF